MNITLEKLYNIKLTNKKQIVYDENLSFRDISNIDEDIVAFMKLIRPTLVFDKMEYSYICDLNKDGTLKNK